MRKTLAFFKSLVASKLIVVSEGNKGVSPGAPNIGGGKELKTNVMLSDAEVKKGGNEMSKKDLLSSVAMLVKGGKEMKKKGLLLSDAEVNNKEEKEMLKGIDVSVGKDFVEVMEFGREGGFRVLMTLPSDIVIEVNCNDSDFIIEVNYGYFIVSKSSGEIHFSPEPEGMIDTLKGGEEMGRLDSYDYYNGEETLFVVILINTSTSEDLFEIPMADVISYQVSESFATVLTLDTVYTVSKLGEVHTSSC